MDELGPRRARTRVAVDVLQALPSAAVVVDGDGRLVAANEAGGRLAVRDGSGAWVDRLSPDGGLRTALATGATVDLLLTDPGDPDEGWLRVRAAAGRGERLIVVDDTSVEHRTALLLHHDNSVEPLTGLPNRASLTRRLEEAVRDRSEHRRGALLFVDLDRFKQVNDTLGHEVGDQVLRTVAARLRRTARADDTVARLGGDEFVLLATDVEDAVEAAHVADRVRHAVEQPVWVEGRPVHVGASVGAVLLDEFADAASALRVADTVMQDAKRARRGRTEGPLLSSTRDPVRHTVSFYEHHELVVAEVADLVGSALVAGRASVVIATPEHRARVDELLAARGVEHASAALAGRYVALDAEQTLASFLVDGEPDPERFERVVGTLVRQLLAQGTGLDAYGEMVSLLWQRGRRSQALALEELWNDLQAELPFRLHCAYAVSDALAPPDAHGMHAVCVRHSHVL